MADEGKVPLTRRDLTIVVAVVGALAVIVGMAGNWLFYSRTEGRVLEERVSGMKDLDVEIVKRMNQLADQVIAAQQNDAKLLELYMKALDEKRKE